MAKKREEAVVVAEPNVVPMVDIMLVLLIIFMVVTPMLSKGVSVDLVRTRNPINMDAADKEDAILVAVVRDGRVYLGSTQLDPATLTQKIQDLLSTKLDKTVFLKCDSRALYERVMEVVNDLRAAGVDNVGLLTDKDKDASPASAGI